MSEQELQEVCRADRWSMRGGG
eukprot:SAG25_NODE_1951_length_2104_cov_25.985928_2_plen_21_part_01